MDRILRRGDVLLLRSVCPTRCPTTRENDKHIGSEDSLPSGVLLPFCGTFSKRSMFSILYPVLRRVSPCDTLNIWKESSGAQEV